MSDWIEIKRSGRIPEDRCEVDVWMNIYASPRSMGWADAFRVPDAYRENGKWFHRDRGEVKQLHGDYITHWMPLPAPPLSEDKPTEGQ
jgi:hypothetical protein